MIESELKNLAPPGSRHSTGWIAGLRVTRQAARYVVEGVACYSLEDAAAEIRRRATNSRIGEARR